jgi:hypothetical protein
LPLICNAKADHNLQNKNPTLVSPDWEPGVFWRQGASLEELMSKQKSGANADLSPPNL